MMFSVVHFNETEEVEVVNSCWLLEDGRCAWPPYKNRRFKKALLEGEIPNEDWEMHSINLLAQYNSFEKASKKCILAEQTSDLESELSEDEKKNRKKRKKVPISDSEDDEALLPLPPQVNRKLLNLANSQRPLSQVRPIHIMEDLSPSLIAEENTSFFVPQNVNGPTEFCYSLSLHTMAAETNRIMEGEPTSTEKRLLSMMLNMQEKLDEVMSMLNILIRKESNGDIVHFFPYLPADSLQSLMEFEQLISEKDTFYKALRHFTHRGGRDLRTTTRNILQCLMTDEVAALFNWAGRGGKEEFGKLRLKNLVSFAVRENIATKDAICKDVEDAIKDWLKYAPARIGRRKQEQ